jgi:hypothetical protein
MKKNGKNTCTHASIPYLVVVEKKRHNETQKAKRKMTTITKNYGPFEVRKKSIEAKLKNRSAILTCERQSGITPMGRKYKTRLQWFIKFQGDPCAMGPWSSKMIRACFA